MHIGMSVNNSTHARIILFLLLRLIILISAKIVNFGVTQCAAATIFSVFLVLCPICNSGKTVCNILPKNRAGATPLWRQSPGAAGAYGGARATRQALASHAIHAALSRRHSRPGGVRPCALPQHGPPRPGQRRHPDGTTGTARTEPDPTAGRNKKQHPPQAGGLQGAGMRATASVTHRARRAAEPLARRPGPASPGPGGAACATTACPSLRHAPK